MESRQIAGIVIAFFFSLTLLGCSQKEKQHVLIQPATETEQHFAVPSTPRRDLYIMVSALGSLEYFKDHQLGMKKAGEALGVETEYVGPDDLNLDAMKDAMRASIAKKPAGMVVVGFDSSLNELVDQAARENIPVVTVDSDLPGSKRVAFVGTGNFQAGYEAGLRLAKLIGGKGKVAIITKSGQPNLEQRVEGYLEALRNYPSIKVVSILNGQSSKEVSGKLVTTLLKQHPDLAGIGCLEAAAGSGVAKAVEMLNRAGQIKVMAMDKEKEVIDYIKKGVISGTVVQQTALMPFYAVQILYALNHGYSDVHAARTPMMIDTGVIIMDKENYDKVLN